MIQTGISFALNEQGRRSNNEDSIYPSQSEAGAINRFFIVCDGMGGHENGEVASNSVCESLAAFLTDVRPSEFNEAVFNRALNFAFDELDQKDECLNPAQKMGTTLAFLYLTDCKAFMAHIGDSRIYLFRKNGQGTVEVIYKSSDHSLVNELLKAEIITEEEAAFHPKRNVITRYMSPHMERRSKADIIIRQDVQAGDRFLLCSDGITECLTDAQLCAIMVENDNEAIINTIRTTCKERSRDNFSAWLVPVTDDARD